MTFTARFHTISRALLAAALTTLFVMPAFAQDFPISADTKVGPRDVLDINVVQDSKFNTKAMVNEEGIVLMPIVGKVDVNGLTTREVEQRIKSILEARFLNKADVSVEVTQFGNKPISVVGAVTHPGGINSGGNLTLIQALTQAGGLTTGYGKTLYVLRTGQNGLTEQIGIDINDLLVNGNPDLNLPLEPNDVINVPVEMPISVYLIGEVMHPGRIEMRRAENPSLLQAIAAAGGPTDRAGRTATIKRAGVAKRISVNFRRIAEGDSPDIPLQDGDTIYLKESFF